MSIQVIGANQRSTQTAAYATLIKEMNLHPENHEDPDPFYVHNPKPMEIALRWCSTAHERVMRRIRQGWRIVEAKRGATFFRIPSDQLDHSNNRCIRLGMVLMEAPISVQISHIARCTVKSLESTDSEIQRFMAMADARDPQAFRKQVVVSDKELVERKGFYQRSRMNNREVANEDASERRNATRAQAQQERQMFEAALAAGDTDIRTERLKEGYMEEEGVFTFRVDDYNDDEQVDE